VANARATELYGPVGREGDEMLAAFTDAQLRVLRDFMRGSRRLQEAHAARIRGSA
jgi:hypothetical protein